MNKETIKFWGLSLILTLCCSTVFSACSISDNPTDKPLNGKVAEIKERGTLLVGTTGDYRPLSFCEDDGTYWGFGIEVAKEIAKQLGVETTFVKTSWPTLTADVLAEPQLFDLAIGGITITDTRLAAPLLNDPFTHGEIGVLMQKGQDDLMEMVNNAIRRMKSDGTLRRLHEKYGLVYAY